MYRSLGFYVGYKAHALNDVASGMTDINDLLQEREQFFYTVKLILNTVPCQFNVTFDHSDERCYIALESNNDNACEWLKDNYCSMLEPSDADMSAAFDKAEEDIYRCFDMVRSIITNYSSRYVGSLLVYLDD